MKLLTLTLFLTMSISDKPAEVVTSLYVAPQLQFKLTKGTVLPHDVIMCTPSKESEDYTDHKDAYVVFACDGGVELRLDNIMFPQGKIAVKIEAVHGDK